MTGSKEPQVPRPPCCFPEDRCCKQMHIRPQPRQLAQEEEECALWTKPEVTEAATPSPRVGLSCRDVRTRALPRQSRAGMGGLSLCPLLCRASCPSCRSPASRGPAAPGTGVGLCERVQEGPWPEGCAQIQDVLVTCVGVCTGVCAAQKKQPFCFQTPQLETTQIPKCGCQGSGMPGWVCLVGNHGDCRLGHPRPQ